MTRTARGGGDGGAGLGLPALLEILGLPADDAEARRLYRALAPPGEPPPAADWRVLAAGLARGLMPGAGAAPGPWDAVRPPFVLGLSGGQGAGKTTLARLLEAALIAAGARAAACSIDDFYLPQRERTALAERVHPLLATRGVPGTHDVALLERSIDALGGSGPVLLPVFDKGADERLPPERWRRLTAPLDVLVLEGWCVGAEPEAPEALGVAVNELEAREDPDGVWRRYVNHALAGPYARLWTRLGSLAFLEVPDLAAVARWRAEQELGLAPGRRMSPQVLHRFVAHYERITRAMLASAPGRARLVVRLHPDHRVAEVRVNP